MVLTGPLKSDRKLGLRRVFVWSSARAPSQEPGRARGDLTRLHGSLGGRHYPDAAPYPNAWPRSPPRAG
jgi:hypothetical protein